MAMHRLSGNNGFKHFSFVSIAMHRSIDVVFKMKLNFTDMYSQLAFLSSVIAYFIALNRGVV